MVTEQAMSDIEKIIFDWLTRHNIQFEFQSSFSGGRYELGGSVVDFVLGDLNILIRAQGDYYHSGVEKSATDDVQRELLESQGWIVVDIYGSDLETPEEVNNTLTKALRGEEMF